MTYYEENRKICLIEEIREFLEIVSRPDRILKATWISCCPRDQSLFVLLEASAACK